MTRRWVRRGVSAVGVFGVLQLVLLDGTVVVDERGQELNYVVNARGDNDTLDDDEVADLLWTTNAPEYYALAVARGWSAATYASRLGDLWIRLLLADPLRSG